MASPPVLPVVVAGALGRMGAEVIKALDAARDCQLVAAIDTTSGKEGADVGLELGLGELQVAITSDFEGPPCWWISPTPRWSTSTAAAPSPTGCTR